MTDISTPFPPPHYEETGAFETDADAPVIVWAHGWGHSVAVMKPVAEAMARLGRHVLIDFPGFGKTPLPPAVWGTADYADHIAAFIRSHIGRPVIWAGHSFGCRVGLQMALRHPDLIEGLFLMAAAGIPKKLPLHKSLYFKARIRLFKILKGLIPAGLVSREWLYKTFGSADYNASGPLRPILVKVVNEDLSPLLPAIRCPVMLVYGEDDTDTPPAIGRRMAALIPGAELVTLKGLDHYSILSAGRHQAVHMLRNFIQYARTRKGTAP